MTEVKNLTSEWKKTKVKYEFKNLDYLRKPISSEDRGKMKERIYDYYGASGVIDKVEDYLFNEPLILVGEDGENLRSRSTALAFLAKGKYWVNNHAHILRPSRGELDFLIYKMESLDFYPYITGSAQPKLTRKNLDNIPLKVPNLITQQKIASFLNQKTSEIDALISDKEKLIELLEEKRQAIITEAVTKGLEPAVKMKDSGVEWIGEIPEHWEISKVKYASDINKDVLLESTEPDFKFNYIDISSVNSSGEIIKVEKLSFKDAPSRARRILTQGDTLVSTVRTYLQAITWLEGADDNFIGSTGYAILTPKNNIEPKYLSYLMRSSIYIDTIVSMSNGVSYPATNSTDIGNLPFIYPPRKEQKNIVNYIDSKINNIINLKKQINNQGQKLKEYRQALIYEAVTGKIDVQEIVKETEKEEVSSS